MHFDHLPSAIRFLCSAIENTLSAFHYVVNSWGFSIILLSLMVRFTLHPLYRQSLILQAKFNADEKIIRPLIEEAKEKHAGDWVTRHEAIQQIQKEAGVSPWGPLFAAATLLIQVPILIAVANALIYSPKLKNESFAWLTDLSVPDALFPCPDSLDALGDSINIMPCAMLLSQLTMPLIFRNHAEDSVRRRSSRISNALMGLLFFVLLYRFPSGVVLYWTSANIFASIQMSVITRQIHHLQQRHIGGSA